MKNKYLNLKNKLIKATFILSNLFYLQNNSFAQEAPEMKFVNNFGGEDNDYFNSVIEINDGSIISVGYSYSADAGFELKGRSDAIIVKSDKEGNQLWIKSWGGSGYDVFKEVIETSDKNIVVVGYSSSKDVTNAAYSSYVPIIIKYDMDGNIVWQEHLAVLSFSNSSNYYFDSITETRENELLVVCRGSGSYIKKYDLAGKQTLSIAASYVTLMSAIQTKDDGIIAVGYSDNTSLGVTNLGGTDALIIKYDSNGNQLWIKNWGGKGDDYFVKVLELDDGSLITIGYSESSNPDSLTSYGNKDAIIVKYNANGYKLWSKIFGGVKEDCFKSAIIDNRQNIIVVGYSFSTNIASTGTDTCGAFIVKYDADGNQIWTKTFSGTGNDYFLSIIETKDGLIAVGYSNSIDAGFEIKNNTDAIIVRYYEEYTSSSQTISNEVNLRLIPQNTLKVSLNTNEIVFEDFSYTQDTEKLGALEITVSSNLSYTVRSRIKTDIIGLNYGEIVDKSAINIKTGNGSYSPFPNDDSSIILLENQSSGNDIRHIIDMKLIGNKMNKVDIYESVIEFEVEQI